VLLRIPSLAERTGDLSGLGLGIFDPQSGATPAARTQFPGAVIPASRIASPAAKLLSFFPAPDVPAPKDQPNYSGSGAVNFNDYGNNLFKFGYALGVNACNCPLIENEKQIQFVNNWSKIQGNHTFKFGADIRQARNLRVPSDQHRAGQLSFNAAGTQGPSGG